MFVRSLITKSARKIEIPQYKETKNILSENERQEITDRGNPKCPFYNVIGQDGAVESILDIVYDALDNPEHLTRNNAILFYGGKSNGKTLFARLTAKVLQRPIIESASNILKSTEDIFSLIKSTATETGNPLQILDVKNGKNIYEFPNVIVFIDEIHGLNNSIITSLLTAFEAKDRKLITKKVIADCRKVLWIGATTERGLLFDAFESRFDKIAMNSYTLDEIAQIVKLNFPNIETDICSAIARQGGLPRISLALANSVELNAKRHKCSQLEALENVSKQRGLDVSGFTKQQLWVLQALANSTIGMNYEQLCKIAQCKVEELKEHILPSLLANTDESLPLVSWNGKYSKITETGRQFLKRTNQNRSL